jgi:membrane protein DedA with SNARE-associated domain
MKYILLIPPALVTLFLGAFLGSEDALPMLDNSALSQIFRLAVFFAGFGYFVWYYKYLRQRSRNETI